MRMIATSRLTLDHLPHRAVIRDARSADFPAIVALNAESERFLSPMSATRLNQLHAWAAYHRVVEVEGQVAAFLLAFREGAGYDSPNYRWFSARYASFVYIDRVVVAGVHRGKGFASALYDDVFEFARENGVGTVTCEFDTDPPNETSRPIDRDDANAMTSSAGNSRSASVARISCPTLPVAPTTATLKPISKLRGEYGNYGC